MNAEPRAQRSSAPMEVTAHSITAQQEMAGRVFLHDLLTNNFVLLEDWEAVPAQVREELLRCTDCQLLLAKLIEQGLLTQYQAARIDAGKNYGLVLGNYRVLDRLGSGGMAIVFKAEHIRMRRAVAIKVLQLPAGHSSRDLRRFYAEIRTVAQLQHPNIVAALDAGEVAPPDPELPVLYYYVMEYVQGEDLERYVETRGPLSPAHACEVIYQVASALAEAHEHHLVHRDIKPSNIMLTPEGQAKLLDFGLVRHFRHRVTDPGTVLGTVDYMAPEQARDASTVDIRTDIYSLGATLFWCLTGRVPFSVEGNILQELSRRLTRPAPSVRAWRPEVPAELDAVIARMLAPYPDDRYPTPQAVMNALLPFLRPDLRERLVLPPVQLLPEAKAAGVSMADRRPQAYQVLIVDDEASVRNFCRYVLEAEGLACDEAGDGAEALVLIRTKRYDLVLLDWAMPGMSGVEVCRKLREDPPWPNLKITLVSAHATPEDLAQMLSAGADDYLTKPFRIVELAARIKALLRLKEAQDRSDLLNRHLLAVNHQLEENLSARESSLVQIRNTLVLALAKIVSYREQERNNHLVRMQRYSRCLAEEASNFPQFATIIDLPFLQTLECCVPLYDIGKAGLPDHILLKPGKLDPEERLIMQTHTVIGADMLKQVMQQPSPATAFLQMAIDIARHHHERYDGTGYPDRLRDGDIPLPARIVAICDVYDALRTRRTYRPALSHNLAVLAMTEGSPGHFDPILLEAFQRRAGGFERVFRELPD